MVSKKTIFILCIISCIFTSSCIKQTIPMVITSTDPLVQKFYTSNHKTLFWFSSKGNSKKAKEWLAEIEAAQSFGIVSDQVQIDLIKSTLSKNKWTNNILKEHTDQLVTGLVIHYLKDLQEGNIHFDYDEVKITRDSVYIMQLLNSKRMGPVAEIVSKLECKDREYKVLKNYLIDSVTEKNSMKYKSVIVAMNYRKYLSMNQQHEFILVNIPEAVARYYRKDQPSIEMRAVVGKKKTPTPTIASYITTIVTFPSWNVPRSIAVKELLPKIKKNENYLEQNNFDVVDAKGNLIEDSELNWEKYTEKNFPYFFRQSTGSENALGVLKFSFQNPFSIFLHSTSWQGVFAKEYRFLSHGCIRLEKPFELTEALLRGTYNLDELKSGKKNTESGKIELPLKIPVFIIYSPAILIDNKVTFVPDIYGLIK